MAESNEKGKKLLSIQNEKLQDLSKAQETRLNSLLLKDKDCMKQLMMNGISYRYFSDRNQQQLFQTIARFYDNNEALLRRDSFVEIVEGNFKEEDKIAKYRTLYDNVFAVTVVPDEFQHLFDGLVGRHLQRQAFGILGNYYEKLLYATSGQITLVEEFQHEVADIHRPLEDQYSRVVTLNKVLVEEVMPEILGRRENPEAYYGIPSGFDCLDEIYNGFRRGKYMVLSAMEGGGKTTVMLNMALNQVKHPKKYRVAYVTIEANASETSKRILTIHSAVSMRHISKGGSSEDGISDYILRELKKAKEEIVQFGDQLHWIQVLQQTPWSRIELMLNRKLAYTDLDVIYVDYLDEIGREVSYPGRPDLELANVSAKVQNFGKKYDVLAVTAQQMKTDKVRELQKKKDAGEDFTFGTGDLSGSKKITAAADYVFGLLIDKTSRDRIHWLNAKARHDESDLRFTLSIDTHSGRIEDLPETFEFEEELQRVTDGVVKDEMHKVSEDKKECLPKEKMPTVKEFEQEYLPLDDEEVAE